MIITVASPTIGGQNGDPTLRQVINLLEAAGFTGGNDECLAATVARFEPAGDPNLWATTLIIQSQLEDAGFSGDAMTCLHQTVLKFE